MHTTTGSSNDMIPLETAQNAPHEWQSIVAYATSGTIGAFSLLTWQEWGIAASIVFGAVTVEINRRHQRRRTKATEDAARAAERADNAKAHWYEEHDHHEP